MILMLVTCIISFFVVIITNILTRVGSDFSTSVYDNFPNKYTLKNKNLLKLYIVYPKSLVTKSSFALYLLSFIAFIIMVILLIIQLLTSAFNEKLVGLIYMICMIVSYVISFGFDLCIHYFYKRKNTLNWNEFSTQFIKEKKNFNFLYKNHSIYLKYEKSETKKIIIACHYVKDVDNIEITTYKDAQTFLEEARFDNKTFEQIFDDLKLINIM